MIRLILLVIAVEGLTEIILHSGLFAKPRVFLSRFRYFKKLFECGWCLSVWVGFFVFGILLLGLEIVLVPIVLHRGSNYLHVIYSFVKYERRRS